MSTAVRSLVAGMPKDVHTYYAEGVVADGVTDNYAYLQSLIDKAEAAGQPADIVLPAGQIVVSDTLVIQGVPTLGFSGVLSAIRLRGQGMLHTQLKSTNTSGALIQIGTNKSINGIQVQDIGLIGPGKTNSGSIGIDAGSVTGTGSGTWSVGGSFNWSNVWIEGFETGLRFLDNTLGTFVNVNVKDCAYGARFGYQSDILNFIGCRFDDITKSCADFTYRDDSGVHNSGSLEQNPLVFLGCRFSANDGANGAVAFDIRNIGTTNVHVQACYFENNDRIALLGETGSSTGPKNIVFDNCYFTVVNNVNPQFEAVNSLDNSILTIRNCRSDAPTTGVGGGWVHVRHNTTLYWEANKLNSAAFQVRRTDNSGNSLDYSIEESDVFRVQGKTRELADGSTFSSSEYPIEVLLTNGSGKNYLHFARLNGATGAVINSDWIVRDIGGIGPVADGLVKINQNASKPSPSAEYQGMLWITKGGAGAADTVEICLKSAADTYSWVTIATG